MMRWIILSGLVVGVTGAATIAVQLLPADVSSTIPTEKRTREPDGPPPKLVIEGKPIFDFGIMSQEQEETHAWTVRNEGEGELRLTYDNSPCTCTSVRYGSDRTELEVGDQFILAPGEETEIFVTWNTQDELDRFRTFAQFVSNDVKEPAPAFTVEGTVAPPVIARPEVVQLPAVPSDDTAHVSVLVYSPSHPEMSIVEPPQVSRPEFIQAEVNPLSGEELERAAQQDIKGGLKIDLTIQPGLPLGRFQDSVILKTDHPVRPQVEIPITGRVVGPIGVVPPSVMLTGVSSLEGGSRTVVLTVRGQEETTFEPEIPDSIANVVEVSVTPRSQSAAAQAVQYELEIQVPPGATPGHYSGDINVKTSHPDASMIQVPVELLIKGR